MGLNRGRGDTVAAHKTFRKSVGVPTLTPPKFRRQLKTTVLTQDAPADYRLPTTLTGNEVFLELNQDPQNTPTATLRTTEEELLTTAPLRSYRRTDDAQVETLDESLVGETDVFAALNALTTTADQLALGDGKAVLRRGTVPIVFPARRYEKSRPRRTPPEFSALIPTLDFGEASAGTAVEPLLFPDDISIIDEQTDAFRHRLRSVTQDLSVLPVSLLNSRTTRNKQVEHVLKTLEDESTTPASPTALLDVSFEQLGDGTAVEEWDYVDALFTEPSYSAEITDPVPPKFRVLVPTRESSLLSLGTSIAPPTLTTGQLRHKVELINAFVKRDSITDRDISVLPVSLVEYKMTGDRQVATVTATLDTGIQLIFPDELTIEANVDNLGDGTSLRQVAEVEEVFPRDSYSTSILNRIPERLRAAIPLKKVEFDEAGAPSTNPTLLTGEFSRTESRVNDFVRRIETQKIDAPTVPLFQFDYGVTEKFGGGKTIIVYTLNTHSAMTADTGLLILDSKLEDLGNGYDVKTTEAYFDGDAFPELPGQEYDDRLNLIIPFLQRVTGAGTNANQAFTDIKPIDKYRQEEKIIDNVAAAAVLDDYVFAYAGTVNIDMPDKLESIEGIVQASVGEGASSETGDFSFVGNYSVSMELRASAQSSATLIPDAIPGIKQFWGSNIDCMNYHFFLPNPVTKAAVLAKVTAIVGGTVLPWPKFNPEIVTIVARGERASLQVTATSKGSAAASDSSSSSTAAGGTGYSRERGLSVKTVRVSATIHPEITVSGDTNTTQGISASAEAEATGLGPDEVSDQDDSVNAVLSPTVIPATIGATDWPASGVYLFRRDAQPFKYDYAQYHVIVVDAADFPMN